MKVGDEVYLKQNPSMKGVVRSGSGHLICVDWSNGISDSHWGSSLIIASEYEKENMKKSGHPNAAILMEIAKEAAVNPEYWKEFVCEYTDIDGIFRQDIATSERDLLAIEDDVKIRRKPRTIRIGDYDVPEPMRDYPENNSDYFLVDLLNAKVFSLQWDGKHHEKHWLDNSLIHKTKEGAELMLKALQELLCKK